MTRGDVGIIVFLVLATALSAVTMGMAQPFTEAAATIKGPGGTTTVDLSVDGTIVIEGRTGPVVFEVRDHALYCIDSSCPDRLCVRMGLVRPGRPVVCAPAGVSAMLNTSLERGGLDAVSR